MKNIKKVIFRFVSGLLFNIYFLSPFSLASEIKYKSSDDHIGVSDQEKLIKSIDLGKDLYIIGPGDLLTLNIIDAPELSGELRVLNDGTIQVPIIGSFYISGLTHKDAQIKLEKLLGDYLLIPDIFISVIDPRPIKVSVVGQVQRPGLYSMDVGSNNNSFNRGRVRFSGMPTVIDAIKLSGGITKQADLRNVFIERRLPGGDLKYKKAKINLLDLIIQGNQLNNPFLFDGDKIIITKALNSNVESWEIADANLTPENISVTIAGEVISPGNLTLQSKTSLSQSIMAAGGPVNWRANKGNVRLVRINRNGSVDNKTIRLDLSEPPSEDKNPILRNGDIVYVETSKFATMSDGITAIRKPASGILSIWSLFKIIGD